MAVHGPRLLSTRATRATRACATRATRATRSIVAIISRAGALAAFLALAACSGATNQDLFEPPASSDTSTTLPSPATTTPSPGATNAEPPDVGTPPLPTPGPDAAPPPDPDDCTPEKEPNNDVTKATPFTARLCGKIDSSTDVDHGTFVVPATATRMTWKIADDGGNVTVRFAGMILPGGADEGDEMRVFPGQTYTVQLRNAQSNGGGKPTYELSLSFK